MKTLLIVLCGSVVLAGCAPQSRNIGGGGFGSNSSAENASVQPFASTLSALNQALADAENSVSVAAACPTGRSNCAGNVRTISYDECSLGSATVTGTAVLTYDSNLTCTDSVGAIPSSGSFVRTTSSIVYTEPSGAKTKISTDNATNYNGQTVGGGIQVNFTGASQYSINILGMHRVRTGSSGNAAFNHSVRTTQNVIASGTRAASNRTIQSGRVVMDHNLANYTATITFNNLVWGSPNCCYPTSGVLTANLTTSDPTTLTMTFSSTEACGVAQIRVSNSLGTSTTTTLLQNCE